MTKVYHLESSNGFAVKQDLSLSPLICASRWETITVVFVP